VTSAARADRPLVLAIDIGSSSVRAAVHDRRGRTVGGTAVQVPYAWDADGAGSVRLAHETLLELVGEVVDRIVGLARPMAPDIVAGGVSCFFHSLAGLDATGRPVTPILSWADTTSADESLALRRRIDPDWAYQLAGVPIHSSYWPARILRLRRDEPRIRRWAGFPELLAEVITGRQVVSRSMASGTGLLDRAAGGWSAALLASLDLGPEDLPELVDDDGPIGSLTGAAARRWPELAHVRWFAPWGDGSCGNVGVGAMVPGRAALMVGTSGALRSYLADPAPGVPDGLFAYRLGSGTVAGGQLSEGGGVLVWVSRRLGRSRFALERVAAALPADGHGLTVLPYPFGERGPGYHEQAREHVAGLRLETDPAAVYRAYMEAIAFGFAGIDDRLSGLLGQVPMVTATGGALARSPLFAQVLADALGRDIAVAPRFEASRHGAALLALQGIGARSTAEAGAVPRTRTVAPDALRAARYREARARQRAQYEAVLG
jgi:gluconokinase